MQTINYILLFFLYSFLGWSVEVICKLFSHKRFINRGFLIGPYCPIYGVATIFMTLGLKGYTKDTITLFIMIVLSISILEYATSYILEKVFNTRWWDYSTYRFNINGRICLETMIPFGVLGLFVIYVSNPILLNFINTIPDIFKLIIAISLVLIFIIDSIISFKIISSLENISKEVKKDSTEKITEKVRTIIKKQNKLFQRRVINAFPNLQFKSFQQKQKQLKKKTK